MITNPRVRKRRIEKLIEKSMSSADRVTPFPELPEGRQSAIRSSAGLWETEEVLIALVQESELWLLVTTERLIWCDGIGVHPFSWHEVRGVQPPKEDFEAVVRGRMGKLDLKVLIVFDASDARYEIELAPGPSYFLAWSAILALGDLTWTADLPQFHETIESA